MMYSKRWYMCLRHGGSFYGNMLANVKHISTGWSGYRVLLFVGRVCRPHFSALSSLNNHSEIDSPGPTIKTCSRPVPPSVHKNCRFATPTVKPKGWLLWTLDVHMMWNAVENMKTLAIQDWVGQLVAAPTEAGSSHSRDTPIFWIITISVWCFQFCPNVWFNIRLLVAWNHQYWQYWSTVFSILEVPSRFLSKLLGPKWVVKNQMNPNDISSFAGPLQKIQDNFAGEFWSFRIRKFCKILDLTCAIENLLDDPMCPLVSWQVSCSESHVVVIGCFLLTWYGL